MKRWLLYIALYSTAITAWSQFSGSAYSMREILPQSNLMNPAFMPEFKVVIGIPGLASIGIDGTMGFSFYDMFEKTPQDSFVIDRENFPNLIQGRLDNSVITDNQLMTVGFRSTSGYFDFSMRLRTENRASYPADLLKWAVWGPADNRVEDQIDLNDVQAYSNNFMEYSVGYAHEVSDKLNLGFRVKYLSGIAGGTGTQNGTLLINSDSVYLSLRDGEYNFAKSYAGNSPTASEIVSSPNTGFGIDAGAELFVSDKLTLTASVLDLGSITWKTNVTGYRGDPVEYTFSGVDFVDLLFNEDASQPNEEADSLIKLLTPRETNLSEFKTGLNTKFTAGAFYDINLLGTVGAMVYSSYNRGKLDPVVSLSYRLRLQRIITLVGGITYRERTVDNIMAGFVVKPGPVQFYLMTDRVNSLFVPLNAHTFNLRMGFNIVLGSPGANLD